MIKNFLLVLVLTISVFAGYSQQLNAVPNDSAVISAVSPDEFTPNDIHIEVANLGVSAVTITWGLVDYQAPSAWELALCDNNNCYDLLFGAAQHISSSVPAGDTMDFKFQYTSHCVTGSGNANIYYFVSGDSANTIQRLNFQASLTAVCTTAISNISAFKVIKIYPNPLRSSFVVSDLKDAGNMSFEVYDLKGSAVKSEIKKVGNEEIEISVENLPKGEYLLKVFSNQGNVIGSSRISKID